MSEQAKAERYEGINGLKAYACLGIVLMHVLANGNYGLQGFVFEKLIPSFTNLVFLFMVVSAFGMCCGYYKKIIDKKITMTEFYSKRYAKIWPYFAMLCVLGFVISPSKQSAYEVFANLTLLQGLLPDARIAVIGVSWTLAVIFVFYLLFPFFCFLLESKVRLWLAFAVSVLYNVICNEYFFDENHVLTGFSARVNILYCAVFFMVGGIVYVYREKIVNCINKYKVIAWILLALSVVAYFSLGDTTIVMLLFCVMTLICAVVCKTGGILNNKLVNFLGSISFEIYLCHMVIYRILEKLHLIRLFDNQVLSYVCTSLMVIIGSIIFAVCAKECLNKVVIWMKKGKKKDV